MRKKVVLYNPKAVFWTMPLPLLAVGSALDPAEFEVLIVDGRMDSQDTLLTALDGALCLGISVLTGAPIEDALTISRLVNKKRPDLPVIWGGWHPSLFAEMCAAERSVSAAVVGQGEESFAEIVHRLSQNQSLTGIEGSVVNARDEIQVNPPRPLRDVNNFPPHNYDLIDVESYFGRKGRRQFDYISSQGCHFRCNFCADPAVFNRRWFGLAPERIVEELAELWNQFRFDDLSFQDETYFTNQRRVAQVAEGFLQRGLEFSWFGTMRADQGRRLDDKILELCARSGLRRVMIGLEAGAQETIDMIQKDIKIEDMFATADKLIKFGVGAIINVIVGFPGESAESVSETLRVAGELRAMSSSFDLAVFYYKPYPGNPIADRLQADGYRFPENLEEWAKFDYVGSSSEWLDEQQKDEIEHFKFYQRFAYSDKAGIGRVPLKYLARWRIKRRFYAVPLERRLIERIRPRPQLS
jgi:radical SAM superfamily enzyme YgiQ (UPF0313 family)